MKEVSTQNFCSFELGTQEGINIPIWIFTVFRQSDGEHEQNLNNDSFCRLPVTSAQCIIGTERYPNSAILSNYDDDDDYSKGYGEIKEVFRALTKDNIIQPYIIEDDFRSSNYGYNIGYSIHRFDLGYQKNFESAQPVKVKIKFLENVPTRIYGYALVLTNRSASTCSDVQRMFDLT